MKGTIEFNVPGWHAIRHNDGWWVGTDKGVVCFSEMDDARVALTILWQRDGGRGLQFRIATFTHADTVTGEYTPVFSAEQALKNYHGVNIKPKVI